MTGSLSASNPEDLMADTDVRSSEGSSKPGDGLVDEQDELVEAFRDAVARRIPDDVQIVPADEGFAVGYPDPLVMSGRGDTTCTSLWSVVRCDPRTMTFTIIDTVTDREVSRFGAGLATGGFRGRVSGDRVVHVYGTRPDGTEGRIGTHVHSARVLHEAIRGPATEQGWVERRPASAIVGLTFGLVAGAGLVVAAVVLGVLFLSGRLP
ncbi:hypothetical protein Cch01nite_19340 [Cellulomonas chitinilytica]|uniref:Uncharacterized protein n=1 Tax=Cellulomonas chitinilytica TaxID=398759 RepID=A0A919P2U1_9CELL|nr:hypothetical protein [Cellulomonas chitinilytica]GIG21210.1 hypothetical protein Cch01nite_19340 [Cellulomonas chitinilytica]